MQKHTATHIIAEATTLTLLAAQASINAVLAAIADLVNNTRWGSFWSDHGSARSAEPFAACVFPACPFRWGMLRA